MDNVLNASTDTISKINRAVYTFEHPDSVLEVSAGPNGGTIRWMDSETERLIPNYLEDFNAAFSLIDSVPKTFHLQSPAKGIWQAYFTPVPRIAIGVTPMEAIVKAYLYHHGVKFSVVIEKEVSDECN